MPIDPIRRNKQSVPKKPFVNKFDPSEFQGTLPPTPAFTPTPRRPKAEKIQTQCLRCKKSVSIYESEMNRPDGYVCDKCSGV